MTEKPIHAYVLANSHDVSLVTRQRRGRRNGRNKGVHRLHRFRDYTDEEEKRRKRGRDGADGPGNGAKWWADAHAQASACRSSLLFPFLLLSSSSSA
jgi:hypothetical protein